MPLKEKEKHTILREVQHGNISALHEFKENFPELHWCTLRYEKTGDTILHVAARLGLQVIVEYLLSNYTPNSVDCTNSDNKTAVHEAAQFAQYDVLKCLVKHGASVNTVRRGDWTPLMLACTKVTSDNVNDASFKCVSFLLQKRAVVNYANKDGWTVLHLIAREGCVKIFYLLLEYRLDVFKVTKNKRTALHVACLHGHLNIVKALLRLDLDPNLKDSSGNNALHEAVMGGNLDVCAYLLRDSVKIERAAVNNAGFGVYHLAASVGSKALLELLMRNVKININLPSRTNLTALHCAARLKRKDIVELLVLSGANACFRDNCGRCAADYMNN